MLSALVPMLLAGLTACASRPAAPPPAVVVRPQLVEIPADLRKCVATSGVTVPDRPLTVAEVERLWKDDRVRLAIVRNCLRRALAFYDDQKRRLAAK